MTPHLNDVLFLNHKGFTRIANLDKYTGLKTLWLESNNLSKIENIDHLSDLRCLFMQNNKIERIENLEDLKQLGNLNLDSNRIEKVELVSELPQLQTLGLARNKLSNAEDIAELVKCENLSVLDLSYNNLEDSESVIDVLAAIPNLRVLYLMGNPLPRKTRDYRRVIISRCKELTYLDQRPVNEKDRLAVEAWQRGGRDEERKFLDEWARREQEKLHANILALVKKRDKNLAKRGIDPQSIEAQIEADEARGRELMAKLKEDWKKEDPEKRRAESNECMEPLFKSISLCLESEKLGLAVGRFVQ